MSSGPDPSVVVLVPWYRAELTPDEAISLHYIRRRLGGLPVRVLKPESLPGTLAGWPIEAFPDRCFAGTAAYSRLLISKAFYDRFTDYDYLLICQLDALPLSSDLGPWLTGAWDYVGAPWLCDPGRPEKGFSRVGNGGFCLRRVAACRRVLEAPRPGLTRLLFGAPPPDLTPGPGSWPRRLGIARELRRGIGWYTANYTLNEDRFWSDRAPLFDPGFCIAPVEAALAFSFEVAPRHCYRAAGERLPLGCHGWAKHDRAFWAEHVDLEPRPIEECAVPS